MAENRVFGTLRSRIFVALFTISLVPIGVLGAQGYHCAMQAIYELAHKHVLAVGVGRSSAVTNWLEERMRSFELMASLPGTAGLLEVHESDPVSSRETVQQSLDTFIQENQAFGAIALLDKHGLPVAESALEDVAHPNLADESLRSAADASEKIVHGMLHPHAAGDVGLHLISAIRAGTGEHVGYLAAYLDLTTRLTPLLQNRQGLYETGKTYLITEASEILTEPLPGESAILKAWKAEPVATGHVHDESPDVMAYTDYRGHLVLGATLPVGFEGWRLVTEIDQSEALVWLNVLLKRVLATGLVTCAVVIAIAFWMSRLVGRPLNELVRISHRIRSGHVGERLDKMGVAEAEEVRRAFNAMLDELKAKQEELVRTETLAYVGELTSSTVHEMRNPLSSIKMNLQALSRSVNRDASDDELCEIALHQSIRLERMLTDLLNFGKPVTLTRDTMRFNDLATAVRDVMGASAVGNGVALHFDDQLDGQKLFADKEQLCRALSSLIGNGMEAMAGPGDIAIVARPCPDRRSWVELAVLDSGPGLTKEALQRAFQPFYTTKKDGTGLGLANVKKIVELHGGTLVVENRPEGGAAIRVCLPDSDGME